MKNRNIKIAVGFIKNINRKLIEEYIKSLEYDILELSESNYERADLFILDASTARKIGEQLLELKLKQNIFVPIIIAIDKNDKAEKWLKAGFDDCLCMPFSKIELKTRIDILLKLRTQSIELKKTQRSSLQNNI